MSRDTSRRNNGGEYDYWTEYWIKGKKLYRQEKCSCDFWQPMPEPETCEASPEMLAFLGGDV